MSLLQIHALSVRYGYIEAVRNMSLEVSQGQALAVIGHNGAGKTTLLSAIAGALPAGTYWRRDGIRWAPPGSGGPDAANWRNASALVPDSGKVFSLLTVQENLAVGTRGGRASALTGDDVYAWFPRLAERRHTLAGNLSGGEQQMLAIGMALLAEPRLLLLDEPTLGLSVPVIEGLCSDLARMRGELGLTILLAEAGSGWVHHLADQVVLVDRGCTVGGPVDLRHTSVHDIEERLLAASGLGTGFEDIAYVQAA